jgi:hypothetical protein
VITSSVRLDADVVCPDGTPAAVTIAADHVTLDLAGHSIVNGRTDAGETVAVTTAGPVSDLEIRNGTIRSGDEALNVQAAHSEFERLDIDGHLLALAATGDHNEFDDLTAASGFHGIDLLGNRLELEDSTITIHPNETVGEISGDRNEIDGNTVNQCGSSGLGVTGDGVEVVRNSLIRCPLFVTGSGTRIERNEVTESADNGISVHDPRAVVIRNVASGNHGGSGIELFDPGAYVARNVTNDNEEWGIEAVLGTIDGGGNRASGNGQPAQCLNVVCGP